MSLGHQLTYLSSKYEVSMVWRGVDRDVIYWACIFSAWHQCLPSGAASTFAAAIAHNVHSSGSPSRDDELHSWQLPKLCSTYSLTSSHYFQGCRVE